MKRQINRLTAADVRNAKRDVCDGFGLWLQFDKTHETKSWLFRFMLDGKADSMGLGPLATTTLARARELAQEAREKLREGINPRLARNAKRKQLHDEAAKAAAIPTFLKCADEFIAAKAVEWSNLKHAAQWRRSFHPGPKGESAPTARLNDVSVSAIDTPLILACLEPLWKLHPVTADRVRTRIENVLDFAKAHNWRKGDNPASWDILKHALPKATAGNVHHAALAYTDIPRFMAELRAKDDVAARQLEFTVLTAARLGEVLRAEWSEIDLQAQIWTVPAERMKARKEHRVPLSDRAVAILEGLSSDGAFLFPGTKAGQPMSERPMRNVLAELRGDVTLHGFRSAFRDWAGDETTFPREIAEAALAHKVGDKTERAYRRKNALERRRKLMDAWAAYCEGAPSVGAEMADNVVKLAVRA